MPANHDHEEEFGQKWLEESLQRRQLARDIVSLRKQEQAERLFKQAVILLNDELYEDALQSLQSACRTYKPLPQYVRTILEVYIKTERYYLAMGMATFLLACLPSSPDLHYLRGVCFDKLNEPMNAILDFERCIELDPSFKKASESLKALTDLVEGDQDDSLSVQFLDEMPEETSCSAALDLDCPSDSEDYLHLGNHVPCRPYNKTVCTNTLDCPFRHAPDASSIRDLLGRNICLLNLISKCEFEDCYYGHDKAHLPSKGWWNDSSYVEYYKNEYDMLEFKGLSKSGILTEGLGRDMNGTMQPWEYWEKLPTTRSFGEEDIRGEARAGAILDYIGDSPPFK